MPVSNTTNIDYQNLITNLSSIQISDGTAEWIGKIELKNSLFPVRIKSYGGNEQLIDLMACGQQFLLISQRLRLEDNKLLDVTQKLDSAGPQRYWIGFVRSHESNHRSDYGFSRSRNGTALTMRPLRNFVNYLRDKNAAGIATLPAIDGQLSAGFAYFFPPCPYVNQLLQRVSANPTIDPSLGNDYLVALLYHHK